LEVIVVLEKAATYLKQLMSVFLFKIYVCPEFKSALYCWLVCEHFGTLIALPTTSRKW